MLMVPGASGTADSFKRVTEHLAAHFRDRPEFFVEVAHRDVDRLPIKR